MIRRYHRTHRVRGVRPALNTLAAVALALSAAPAAAQAIAGHPIEIKADVVEMSLTVQDLRADLERLLADGRLKRGDTAVMVAAPAGLSEMALEALRPRLGAVGVSLEMAKAGARAETAFVLRVVRRTAVAPGCPDWSRSEADEFANRIHADFGCATAQALAAMVAAPEDLRQGRDLAAAVGDVPIQGLEHLLNPPGPTGQPSARGEAAPPPTPGGS